MSKKETGQNRERAFAKKMRRRNWRGVLESRIEWLMIVFVTLASSVAVEYDQIFGKDRYVSISCLAAVIAMSALYAATFMEIYISTESEKQTGKIIRRTSSYMPFRTLSYMPFSGEKYFSEIKRDFRIRQCGTMLAVFLICFLGMWVGYDGNDNLQIYYLQAAPPDGYLLKGIAVCVIGALGIYLLMELLLRFNLWELKTAMVLETDAEPGDKKNVKTDNAPFPARKARERKRAVWLRVLFLVTTVGILYGFNKLLFMLLHPLPKDSIVYYSQHMDLLVPFASGIYLWELLDCVAGEVMAKKKIAAITLAVLACIFFSQTALYATYYEDKIELGGIVGKKEYAWEDVNAYEISTKDLNTEIQLKLTMKDGKKLRVISDSFEASALYYDTYENAWEYVGAVVKRLDALGSEGGIKDDKKLEECAKEYGGSAVEIYRELEKTVRQGDGGQEE